MNCQTILELLLKEKDQSKRDELKATYCTLMELLTDPIIFKEQLVHTTETFI